MNAALAAVERIPLQMLREQSELTQEKLAEKAGLNVETIHALESGRATPRSSRLVLDSRQ